MANLHYSDQEAERAEARLQDARDAAEGREFKKGDIVAVGKGKLRWVVTRDGNVGFDHVEGLNDQGRRYLKKAQLTLIASADVDDPAVTTYLRSLLTY